MVEGFTLVLLCNYRPAPRKLAVHIMKEVKSIMKLLGIESEPPLIDVIDRCCPQVKQLRIYNQFVILVTITFSIHQTDS